MRSSGRLRALAIRGTWKSAASGEMSGSRPLADVVTRSAGTAAVGSYTTFSTWILESQRLTEERQHLKALLNIVVSLVLGVGAAELGRLLGAHL